MSDGRRRLIVEIFKNFWQSLQPRQISGNKIGSDSFGNTYFEIPADPRRGKRKNQRWFTPKAENGFDQERPAEWDSWLRGRRIDPPSDEEIQKNIEIMVMKKKNSAKLEAEYAAVRPNQVVETKKTGYESFPKYDEYELSPGEHLKDKT